MAVAAIVLAACSGATGPTQGSAHPSAAASGGGALGSADRPIVMAFVPSQDTARIAASGKAITNSLEKATNLKWDVKVPTSYAATVEGLCSGQIDVAWLNTLSYVLANSKNCGDLMFTTLRNDEKGTPKATYDSQIIVRADSGIASLKDLKGKKFAFVDPLSTSGTLFPTLKIKQDTGQDPKAFFSQTVYAGGHDKSVLAVYQGSVDGAASFIDARTLVQKQFPDIMDKTKRIATAGPIPNDTVTVRKSFPADLRSKIQSALLDYAKSDAGKKALKSLYSIDGLAVGDPKVYDPILDAVKTAGLSISDIEKDAQVTAKPAATAAPSKSP
jgi:phosphonate transport system substrate-binding protein